MTTISVLDANGVPQNIETPNANGRAAAAASRPIALSTEDKAALDTLSTAAKQDLAKAVLDAISASVAGTLKVGSTLANTAQTVTRPANTTAYSVNDAIGTATTHVVQLDSALRTGVFTGYVTKAVLETSQAACVAQIRVHLFRSAPTAIVDNAALAILIADESNYLGFFDMPAFAQEGAGSTAALSVLALQFPIVGTSTTIFAALETKTAFTPDSAQQFKIRLTVDQN